jgi:hypothetical protein
MEPILKRWWFWAIVAVVFITISASNGNAWSFITVLVGGAFVVGGFTALGMAATQKPTVKKALAIVGVGSVLLILGAVNGNSTPIATSLQPVQQAQTNKPSQVDYNAYTMDGPFLYDAVLNRGALDASTLYKQYKSGGLSVAELHNKANKADQITRNLKSIYLKKVPESYKYYEKEMAQLRNKKLHAIDTLKIFLGRYA